MRKVTYRGKAYRVSAAHPAADLLPWDTDGANFADLVESVRAGFDPERPVVRLMATGAVVGGRRRELACRVAGVVPVYRDVDWDAAAVVAFVEREDLFRRDLTPGQRAMIAVGLTDLLPEGRPGKTPQRCGVSASKIAEESGVSQRTVEDAAKVKKKAAPEVAAAVRDGKLPVHTAAKVADLPKDKQREVAAAPDPKKAAKAAVASAPKPPRPRKPTPDPAAKVAGSAPAADAPSPTSTCSTGSRPPAATSGGARPW
jgi:hypothetical protein